MDGEMYNHKQGRKPVIKGTRQSSPASRLHRQGDKGPPRSHTEKKGRDASGASEGAEALIASSVKLNL